MVCKCSEHLNVATVINCTCHLHSTSSQHTSFQCNKLGGASHQFSACGVSGRLTASEMHFVAWFSMLYLLCILCMLSPEHCILFSESPKTHTQPFLSNIRLCLSYVERDDLLELNHRFHDECSANVRNQKLANSVKKSTLSIHELN